jgi:hypothetical protein
MQTGPIKENKYITLIDAGLNYNLPIPPLLRTERQIDLIIVFDFSAHINNAKQLLKAESYANKNNLLFPKIKDSESYKTVTNTISIFMEKDPKTPAIIYFPLVVDKIVHDENSLNETLKNNPLISEKFTSQELNELKNFDLSKCTFCSTFNLTYTEEEFRKLHNLIKFNLILNIEKIKETILKKIEINKAS